MKTIQLPHGTKHVCVSDVFRLMLENRDESAAMDVFVNGAGNMEVRHRGGPFPWEKELQGEFLKFCEEAGVAPRNHVTPWSGGYTGEGLQNGLYHVTVDEFRRFSEPYGFSVDVENGQPSDLRPDEVGIQESCLGGRLDVHGVSKGEILAIFTNPIAGQTEEQWAKMLADGRAKWLIKARVDAGGKGVQSRWNPAKLAMCLDGKGHMRRRALGAIIRRSFPEYLDEWEAYAGSFD